MSHVFRRLHPVPPYCVWSIPIAKERRIKVVMLLCLPTEAAKRHNALDLPFCLCIFNLELGGAIFFPGLIFLQ